MPEVSRELFQGVPFQQANFLDTPQEQHSLQEARVVLVPVPYDSTTSYQAGARDAPSAIIEASRHIEDFDLELLRDISEAGIYTMPSVEPYLGSPEGMVDRVSCVVGPLARLRKIPVVLGGDHSVSVGSVKALREVYQDLSVLFLDAHGDLRYEYMGTPWGHASTARRISEICPVVEVGVRSLSQDEYTFIQEQKLPVFFRDDLGSLDDSLPSIVSSLSSHVYVSVDLDVLDPSIMPAVGTPEPGGLSWQELLHILRRVGQDRTIVGFDIMELSPRQGQEASVYTAAKLVYKLIGYATS